MRVCIFKRRLCSLLPRDPCVKSEDVANVREDVLDVPCRSELDSLGVPCQPRSSDLTGSACPYPPSDPVG